MAKFRELVISDIVKETSDTVSIAFDVPEDLKEEFSFKPGQYLTLRAEVNGEDLRRSYSICAAPFENELRVAIKKVEEGKFSTFSNEVLKTGDTLKVMKPMGRFVANINPEHKKNYLLIAAGSGVTPILSIAKTVLAEEPKSTVTFLYGNKTFDSIIFREQVEGLKNNYMDRFRVSHILSRESLGSELSNGRINAEKCELFAKTILNIDTINESFLCGPAEMIEDVSAWLKQNGLTDENVHFELFTTPGMKKPAAKPTVKSDENTTKNSGETCEVTVIIDGDSMQFSMDKNSEQSILDLATEKGADLPFSCKGGVCCTCKAKVLEGKATMDVNYALEPHEVENGFILSCQAKPTTSTITVDFDHI